MSSWELIDTNSNLGKVPVYHFTGGNAVLAQMGIRAANGTLRLFYAHLSEKDGLEVIDDRTQEKIRKRTEELRQQYPNLYPDLGKIEEKS